MISLPLPPSAPDMAWAKPVYTKKQVDAAGKMLAKPFKREEVDAWVGSFRVADNWRTSHSFPLNTFQLTLRRRARQVYQHALVAQRIKRFPSIISKLRRYPTMSLAQMQDLGGCRAVVDSVASVKAIRAKCLNARAKHVLVREKDYIACPKDSGYRGIHLVYRYQSHLHPEYNGLQVEIQLRSHVQHAWATAVETVGTFLQQALKASEGAERWLRFFRLTGTAFALFEKSPPVPNTIAKPQELKSLLRAMSAELAMEQKLSAFGAALRHTVEPARAGSHYFLLELNPAQSLLRVRNYSITQLQQASDDYAEAEKAIVDQPTAQAVLVGARSLDMLRRAYPNYFLDTARFIRYFKHVIA